MFIYERFRKMCVDLKNDLITAYRPQAGKQIETRTVPISTDTGTTEHTKPVLLIL